MIPNLTVFSNFLPKIKQRPVGRFRKIDTERSHLQIILGEGAQLTPVNERRRQRIINK